MTYVAIINTPGYLPDVQPEEFDTCREAWAWLAEECRQRDDVPVADDELVLVMDRDTGQVTGVLPAGEGERVATAMDLMANEHIWSLATDEEGAESIALFFREAGLGMDGTGHFTVAGTVYEVRLSETLVTRSNQ